MSFGGVAVIGLLLAVAACARAVDPLPGYVRASVEERAELMRAIADYYGVRGRAFVSGEATTRLATFPKLEPARIYVHGTSAVAFVHCQAWLVVCRRSVEYAAIVERELGPVPGTND